MENGPKILSQERADSLFSEATLAQFKNIKATIQKAAIWIFVGGVILSAVMIAVGGIDEFSVFGKLSGTLMILALMLIVSVFDFAKIETGNKETQLFAFIGVISNVFWALLWIGLIWGVFNYWTDRCISVRSSYYSVSSCYSYAISFFGKMALISSFLSALGLFGSAIMGIKEYDKSSSIRPLKITAIACLTYEMIFWSITTFMNFQFGEHVILARLAAIAGLAAFVWFVAGIVAAFISRGVKNSKEYERNKELMEKGLAAANAQAATPAAPKTDEELRAEIEEKVRREMIEKEVREKLEKEMAEKKANGQI